MPPAMRRGEGGLGTIFGRLVLVSGRATLTVGATNPLSLSAEPRSSRAGCTASISSGSKGWAYVRGAYAERKDALIARIMMMQ